MMTDFGGRPRKPSIQDDVPPDDDESDQEAPSNITYISKQSRLTIDCMDHHAINYDLILLLLESLCFYKTALVPFSTAILIFLPSLESIRKLCDLLEGHEAFGSKDFLVLPLHSTISNENQGLVFEIPPPGVRKIVYVSSILCSAVSLTTVSQHIDQSCRDWSHDSRYHRRHRHGKASRDEVGILLDDRKTKLTDSSA